jgi:hypothetical protein
MSSFPLNPVSGQLFTNNLGTIYVYDAIRTAWIIQNSGGGGGTSGFSGYSGVIGPIYASQVGYSGYSGITNVEQALNLLLRVAPKIISFTNDYPINQKTITPITVVTVSWTIAGDAPTFTTLTSVPSFSLADLAIGHYTYTGLSITTDTTYTLTIGDNVQNPSSIATTTVHFTQKMYYGNNANTSLASAEIIALQNNFLTDSRLESLTIDGDGNYLYICYPIAYGVAAMWVSGLLDSSWQQSIVSVTNELGFVEDYYVYRSFYVQQGTGIPVQIK